MSISHWSWRCIAAHQVKTTSNVTLRNEDQDVIKVLGYNVTADLRANIRTPTVSPRRS